MSWMDWLGKVKIELQESLCRIWLIPLLQRWGCWLAQVRKEQLYCNNKTTLTFKTQCFLPIKLCKHKRYNSFCNNANTACWEWQFHPLLWHTCTICLEVHVTKMQKMNISLGCFTTFSPMIQQNTTTTTTR